jgi:hypothetical protein
VATQALLASILAYLVGAVAQLVYLWQDYGLVRQLIDNPQGVDIGQVTEFAAAEATVFRVSNWLLLLILGIYLCWTLASSTLLRRYGLDPRSVRRHWAMRAWRVGILVSVALYAAIRANPVTATDLAGSMIRYDQLQFAATITKIVMVVLLGLGTLAVRTRIRQAIAQSDGYRPGGGHRHVVPAMPSVRAARPADDAFWAEVANLAGRAEVGVPLLESSGETHRWHIISPATDLSAVRATLPPGAVITAYSQPPQPADDRSLGRVAGRLRALARSGLTRRTVGLIEESAGGVVHYDELCTEDQLVSWLARARLATRAGAYPADPADDPSALSAVAGPPSAYAVT